MGFFFQIFYCFALFKKLITLAIFTEITLIKREKKYNNKWLGDQSSKGFRVQTIDKTLETTGQKYIVNIEKTKKERKRNMSLINA